jgi:tetratricopeptide (TPR) repeat protein
LKAIGWLILAVASVPAMAVTDADRLKAYREFRTAFDARQYKEALPLAERVVALTEEQYGSKDRALINPLSNLATTQFRLGDYKSAETAYLRSVKIVEDSGGNADRLLLRPLHGLGATYYVTGQYEDASLALKRALDLSRNLDGLFNTGQVAILDPLIESLVSLERHDEAEREYQYAVRIEETAFGPADVHVLHPLDHYARWLEHLGRYANARALHARSLAIAEQVGGRNSPLTVDPLVGIARSYRLEFVNGGEDSAGPVGDPFAPGNDFAPSAMNGQRLNPDGERALQLALQAIDKTLPVDHTRRGLTLIELGDWYMSGGVPVKGMQSYHDAWKELSQGGSTAPLAAPRQLAYRPPSSAISRSRLTERDNIEEHFVEATFTVTREGRVTDISASSTDATESQQKIVLAAVKRARYAPAFENGEPVDAHAVKLRERIVVKKSR